MGFHAKNHGLVEEYKNYPTTDRASETFLRNFQPPWRSSKENFLNRIRWPCGCWVCAKMTLSTQLAVLIFFLCVKLWFGMDMDFTYLRGWADKNFDLADVVGFRKTVDFALAKWPEGRNFESIRWPIAFYNRKSKNDLLNWVLLKIH